MKKLLILTFVCLLTQSAYAADPLKVHEAGFGPEIREFQLGKPMTWLGMIPYLPPSSVPNLGMLIADNYKAVVQQAPLRRKGKWIQVTFILLKDPHKNTININTTMIQDGDRNTLLQLPKNVPLDDLFASLEKSGLNYISIETITTHNKRIIEYSVDKKDLPTEAATAADFAQWLSKTYALGTMEQKGKEYELRNPSEGWRVLVSDDKVTVFSMPIKE